jgi:CubicO group peptidase (beta-lactamase class C family)
MRKEHTTIFIRKIIASLIAASVILSMPACSQGNSKYALENIELTEDVRTWVCPEEQYADTISLYRKEHFKGTTVVATDEEVLFLHCENAVEKDGVTLVSQNTIFDLASMSKTITAVAILQLAEKGQLNINDTLDKFFPGFEAGKQIRVYDLLHMRSGLPDYLNQPEKFWPETDDIGQLMRDLCSDKITDEEFLAALYSTPNLSEAGQGFTYCNTNYRLLAMIVENLSGMKFCDYLQKNIFDVCGMTHTTSMALGDLTYVPTNFSAVYNAGLTDENGYPMDANNSRGDGGIHSCLTDMLAFDRALFCGKLLSKESMETMLYDEDGYCCGLFHVPGYYHAGKGFTTRTQNTIVPSEEYGHIYIIRLSHS